MKYRPDVDGLRAIAVLSVIIYHIWPAVLPGGFVGVDIFFVISGYLISLQIYGEIQDRRFSIAEFYRRRIKRIAPAMIAVVTVTVICAELFLRPQDSEAVSRSAAWSLLSMANIYFWFSEDLGYFAQSTEELPLLHLWSLGVEEQFYVLWPLILGVLSLHVFRRSFLVALLLVIVASTAFGQWYFAHDPSFVFYMLPARAGELMLGALLAWWVFGKRWLPEAGLANAIGFAAFALLVASLVWVSEERVFPGVQAMVPATATAALILVGANSKSFVTRLLQNRLFVLVGLVSYSAYLWHWPLLAFLHYGTFSITPLLGAAVLSMTFVMATLSYRYVEIPFRRSRAPLRVVALRQFAVPVLILLAFCAVSLKTNGYTLRWLDSGYRQELMQVQASLRPAYKYEDVCQKQRLSNADLEFGACVHGRDGEGNAGDSPSVLLFGDSNAAQYVGVMATFADAAGFRIRNLAIGSCPPLFDRFQQYVEPRRVKDCRDSLALVRPTLTDYDLVVLAASWSRYAQEGNLIDDLGDTIRSLLDQGVDVVILARSPVIEGYDRKCREKAISFPLLECKYEPVPLAENVRAMNAQLSTLADGLSGVSFYNANSVLCPDNECPLVNSEGVPLYYDSTHISMPTSWWLGEKIVESTGTPDAFKKLSAHSPQPARPVYGDDSNDSARRTD